MLQSFPFLPWSSQLENLHFVISEFDFHPKQSRRECFPLGVSHKGQRAATTETLVQQKVQRAEIRQFESFDFALADTLEVFLNALRRNLADEDRINLIPQSNQSDVGGIALVTRASVCKFYKLCLHCLLIAFTQVR